MLINLLFFLISNKILYDKVVDTANDEKLGLTPSERIIKQIGVKNGERAKFILNEIKQFKTIKEKNEYLQTLWDKKILTPEVQAQFKYFLKKGL